MKKEEIKAFLEEKGIKVEERVVMKNGIPVNGFVLGSGKVRPTIYAEQIADMEDHEVFSFASRLIEESPYKLEEFTKLLKDKIYVMDNVIACIQKDDEEDLVTRKYKDLHEYMRIKIHDDFFQSGSVKITESLLKEIEIPESTLFQIAEANSFSTTTIKPLWEILSNQFGIDAPGDNDCPMYVLSCNDNIHGAVAIKDKTSLKKFLKEKGVSSAVILPSSIHECIIWIGDDEDQDFEQIIREVNETQVSPYERLSNHSYRFTC